MSVLELHRGILSVLNNHSVMGSALKYHRFMVLVLKYHGVMVSMLQYQCHCICAEVHSVIFPMLMNYHIVIMLYWSLYFH